MDDRITNEDIDVALRLWREATGAELNHLAVLHVARFVRLHRNEVLTEVRAAIEKVTPWMQGAAKETE